MTASVPPDDIVISDSTVLINFLNTGKFELLLQIFDRHIHITDLVRGEVKHERDTLEKAIGENRVVVHKTPVEKVQHLTKSFSQFNPGEASCFLLAKEQGWCIATDDGGAKRMIRQELGNAFVITTFDIVLKGVRLGVIKKNEASNLIQEMEQKADAWFSPGETKQFQYDLRQL